MTWNSDDDLLAMPLEVKPIKMRQFALSDGDLVRLINAKLGDAIPSGRTVVEIVSACKGMADRTISLQRVLSSVRLVLAIEDDDERDQRLNALITRGTA